MTVRLDAVTFDVAEPARPARFWAELLGRDARAEPGGVLVAGDPTRVALRFVTSETAPAGRPRLHLHLTSSSPDDQRRTVDTALRLGARHLDVGQRPDEGHVVLADPVGTEFCVIEAGNGFLAGTGYLGEVTCDGSRAAGLFWRDALGWQLVWDQGEQTAVQSPLGGTKLSWDAWGGGGPAPGSHQRFDLVADDLPAAVERLVALGATRHRGPDARVVLADPDGVAFGLRAG